MLESVEHENSCYDSSLGVAIIAMGKNSSIRSISRALRVLQAINRHDYLTLDEISEITQIPYSTAWRILSTLEHENIIERDISRKHYRATALALSLSYGYQAQAKLVAIARPHIVKLTCEIGWPVCILSRVGAKMVVQDSTHELTPLTFSEYHPGYSIPIESSASGKAYLAFIDPKKRKYIIDQLKHTALDANRETLANNLQDHHFKMIIEDGYASFIRNPHAKDPGKRSSIAVPLYRDEMLVGVLTLLFFSTTLRVVDAFKQYEKSIFEAQTKINRDLVEVNLFTPDSLD